MEELSKSQKQPLEAPDNPLPEISLQSLDSLGKVLFKIHQRMVSEGFELINGEIRKSGILEKND